MDCGILYCTVVWVQLVYMTYSTHYNALCRKFSVALGCSRTEKIATAVSLEECKTHYYPAQLSMQLSIKTWDNLGATFA